MSNIRNLLSWKGLTIILCLYGFFKELRPSEAWLTRYLKENKNLTENEVNNQIYPIWTYSAMVALLVVLLITDIVQHTPIIALEGVAYIATWALIIWGEGVFPMQMMQFVYGWATSTEIAYYSYVYLIVSEDQYQKVTSFTRSSILCGRFLSGLFAQLFVTYNVMNYLQLNYFSLVSVATAMILSIALLIIAGPRRTRRTRTTILVASDQEGSTNVEAPPGICDGDDINILPTHRGPLEIEPSCQGDQRCCMKFRRRVVFEMKEMYWGIKSSYSDLGLLKWSVWWALATCGFMQVGNYGQNLWDEILIDQTNRKLYNGTVEAVSTVLGAIMAFSVGFVKVNWKEYGELLLFVMSFLDGMCLMVMSQTTEILTCYILYIVFRSNYHLVITVASFQIATYLETDRYGLIFGCNTFIALVLQSIITFIVVDKHGLNTPVRPQFMVYSGYFIAIGLIFMFAILYQVQKRCRNRQAQTLEIPSQN
ncbi:thiamine transporter 2-like [Tubulanus polymorphus]|uniref:thiamine transporter 2-like n=1 Tax=Tubulanus polymorphus TaxID=672921 RepID=UPI003DA30E33